MPPIYEWHCPKCKKRLDVLRSFDGFRDPPTAEEAGPGECEHEFEKKIHAPLVARGPGWGGSKGNWVLALLFAAASLLSGCQKCTGTKTIKTVGGCDHYGVCGIVYTDGTSGMMAYPTPGDVVDWPRPCKR